MIGPAERLAMGSALRTAGARLSGLLLRAHYGKIVLPTRFGRANTSGPTCPIDWVTLVLTLSIALPCLTRSHLARPALTPSILSSKKKKILINKKGGGKANSW